MKIIRSLMTAGALTGMFASGAAMAGETTAAAGATTAPTAQVATSDVRQSANVDKKSKLTGEAIVPVGLAAAAVIGGIVIAVDDDDDDTPDSAG
ncbi:hypothetical protein [Stakelama saccharophila]|uniref:Uncharacterized protein n=1 Tax=Stakelama saccharophila TaxID=3075605 RepID=A0ABZ0B9M4_9SPHN|nr:hypothetical protein [Stakelama sp. W311]WNO53019.1 hypothetical protein RPR59_11205 [Stakelama sp. W311]